MTSSPQLPYPRLSAWVHGGALQHAPVVVDGLDEDFGCGDGQVVEAIPGRVGLGGLGLGEESLKGFVV